MEENGGSIHTNQFTEKGTLLNCRRWREITFGGARGALRPLIAAVWRRPLLFRRTSAENIAVDLMAFTRCLYIDFIGLYRSPFLRRDAAAAMGNAQDQSDRESQCFHRPVQQNGKVIGIKFVGQITKMKFEMSEDSGPVHHGFIVV